MIATDSTTDQHVLDEHLSLLAAAALSRLGIEYPSRYGLSEHRIGPNPFGAPRGHEADAEAQGATYVPSGTCTAELLEQPDTRSIPSAEPPKFTKSSQRRSVRILPHRLRCGVEAVTVGSLFLTVGAAGRTAPKSTRSPHALNSVSVS